MRIIERECDACGRRVATAKHGDVCGACDLAMCKVCLEGTARCPSCQRAFAETRDVAAVARATPASPGVPIALLAVLAILIGITYAYFQGRGDEEPATPRGFRGDVAVEREPFVAGAAACVYVRTRAMGVLDQLSRMRLAPADPDDFDWGMRPVLGALRAEVRPSRADGVGPITRTLSGVATPPPEDGYTIRLVVDGWADPTVDAREASGGRLTGRLFVTGQTGRVECAAEVDHSGSVVSAPDGASTLGTGRFALLIGALRTGIERMQSTDEIDVPTE